MGRHTGLNGLARKLALKRLQPGEFTAVGNMASVLPDETKTLPEQEQTILVLSAYVDQLLKSKSVLKNNGIVLILPDVQGGLSSGYDLPFHGRMVRFKAGFAELAIETGAAVVPVSITVDVHKRKVRVRFLEPLDSGPADRDHAEKVEGLIRQYADYFEGGMVSLPGDCALKAQENASGIKGMSNMSSPGVGCCLLL